MKPHLYIFMGRWTYTTYGKVKSSKSLAIQKAEIGEAHDWCVRANRKRGVR